MVSKDLFFFFFFRNEPSAQTQHNLEGTVAPNSFSSSSSFTLPTTIMQGNRSGSNRSRIRVTKGYRSSFLVLLDAFSSHVVSTPTSGVVTELARAGTTAEGELGGSWAQSGGRSDIPGGVGGGELAKEVKHKVTQERIYFQ